MDITPYVEGLRRDLIAAAAAGPAEVQAAAERLALALDPAARLALMEALSHAAGEITAALPSGGVQVRLDGRDLDFVVEHPAPPPTTDQAIAPEPETDGDVARVSLRLPENVKSRAEEAAAQARMSLNTWLVGVIRAATRAPDQVAGVDLDLTSLTAGGPGHGSPPRRGTRRLSGWI